MQRRALQLVPAHEAAQVGHDVVRQVELRGLGGLVADPGVLERLRRGEALGRVLLEPGLDEKKMSKLHSDGVKFI